MQNFNPDLIKATKSTSEKLLKVPASPQQKGIWFHTVANNSTAYWNFTLNGIYRGTLNVQVLKEAIGLIIQRHSALRTRFVLEDDTLYTVTSDAYSLDEIFQYKRFKNIDESLLESLISEEISKVQTYEFDYQKEHLIRVCVLDFDNISHVVVVVNHIVTDSVSMQILWTELNEIYSSLLNKVKLELPSLKKQYSDFCFEYANFKKNTKYAEQKKRWLQKLSKKPPNLNLSFFRVKSDARLHVLEFTLPEGVIDEIKTFSYRKKVTYSSVFLLAYYILLHTYSNRDTILLGNIFNGRLFKRRPYNSTMGLFADRLISMLEIRQDETLLSHLKKLNFDLIDDFKNTDIVYDDLLWEFNRKHKLGTKPLFQNTFNLIKGYNPTTSSSQIFKKSKFKSALIENPDYDLGLVVMEQRNNALLKFKVNCDDVFAPVIQHIQNNYCKILKTIITDPMKRIIDLDLLNYDEDGQSLTMGGLQIHCKDELKRITQEFNQKTSSNFKEHSVSELFEQQVLKSPKSTALVFGDKRISYSELNQKSNQLANYLVDLGVEKETLVAICLERSVEMIIAILGVIKAGGAYVPIDPKHPIDRIAFILKDCAANIVLSTNEAKEGLIHFKGTVVSLDTDGQKIEKKSKENLFISPKPEDLMYVIYTSGSTGRPKGVMAEHKGVVSLITDLKDKYQITSSERILLFANYIFDASIEQIFLALLSGSELCIIENELLLNETLFKQYILDNRITHLHATPTYLNAIDPSGLHTLKRVIFGGEYLSEELFTRYKKVVPFAINEYGPTEATITTMVSINSYLLNKNPIVNTKIYILDNHQKMVPIGVTGEIYIGGQQVARGYLNHPELNKKHFLENPFDDLDGTRMYRTGDLGRWLPDGQIEFFGRNDDRVKLRGYLIELGEIESVLSKVEGVQQCTVLLSKRKGHSEASDSLIAYYVPNSDGLTKKMISSKLAEQLPEYMMPNVFIAKKSFPYTSTGKIDKQRLLDSELELDAKAHIAPKNPIEMKVCALFSEILEIDQNRIGIEDSFFDIGGNSILAMQLLSKLEFEFNIQVKATKIFELKTVKEISKFLTEIFEFIKTQNSIKNNSKVNGTNVFLLNQKKEQKPLFILPGTPGYIWLYDQLANKLEDDYCVYGIQIPGLEEGEEHPQDLAVIANIFIKWIKSIQQHGAFRFIGHSFGSYVGFEVVKQLEKEGHQVEFLAILDSHVSFLEFSEERLPRGSVSGLLETLYKFARDFKFPELLKHQEISEITHILEATDVEHRISVLMDHVSTRISNRKNIDITLRVIKATLIQFHTNYRVRGKIKAKIIVFKAIDGFWKECDESLGWSEHSVHVKTYKTTGDHSSIIRGANINYIKKALQF